jgi:hypothetical protein
MSMRTVTFGPGPEKVTCSVHGETEIAIAHTIVGLGFSALAKRVAICSQCVCEATGPVRITPLPVPARSPRRQPTYSMGVRRYPE